MRTFSNIKEVLFLEGPAACNLRTGELLLNPNSWEKLGNNSRKFILAHELGHLNATEDSEKAADEWAMWRNMQLGSSSIEQLQAFYHAMPFTTPEQVERGENLLEKIFLQEVANGNEKARSILNLFNDHSNDDEIRGAGGKTFSKLGAIGMSILGCALIATGIGAVAAPVCSAAAAGLNANATRIEGKQAAAEQEKQQNNLEQQAFTQLLNDTENRVKQQNEAADIAKKTAEMQAQQAAAEAQKQSNYIKIAILAVGAFLAWWFLIRKK